MLAPSTSARRANAHMIVVGNEKGGSGKSTTAMHVVVALLKAGQTVAAIDLDGRQQSLARYVENRRNWSEQRGLELELPTLHVVRRVSTDSVRLNEGAEFAAFAEAVAAVEPTHDFVVIDTPGSDSYLMRLAHSMADTLVTPLNDSFVDLDVLGVVNPATFDLVRTSAYAEMVAGARRQRVLADGGSTDWILLRNRLSMLDSRNNRAVADALSAVGMQLGFRIADGIAERVVYREFFPLGLTALDPLDEAIMGGRPGVSHLSARHEVRSLMRALRLPIDDGAFDAVGPAPSGRVAHGA